ncbi:LPS assembly lipoprotein LptE [Pseudomonas sp. NW5]|uniref:LPS-assembly lipoprotein LptE n=1 Tax=Pseudomonas sp. NW5 TaxID=2934934 RepID=UPI00202079C9|nr:LPS assembly lipoprotein LptE [Pseudomonas sp. NW5]MCL7462441.1 LPS assembly lipoprotein LptE [Pseudomonas sp. NW5]
MKRSLSGLLLVILATLLSACGFQLRGTAGNDFAVQELDLRARNAYGELNRDLRQLLESRGVRISPDAAWRLVLVNETQNQRTASVTRSARSAEYELTTILDFELRDRADLLLLADRLEVQKVYVQDDSNLIGSSQEAAQLRREMRRELVQQMSLRLQQLTQERLEQLQRDAEQRAEARRAATPAAAQ